jgi:hypothetical protein
MSGKSLIGIGVLLGVIVIFTALVVKNASCIIVWLLLAVGWWVFALWQFAKRAEKSAQLNAVFTSPEQARSTMPSRMVCNDEW